MKDDKKEVTAQYWARDIKRITLKNLGYPIDVFERIRIREIVYYRAMHIYLCSKYLNWSQQRILRFYKNNGGAITNHASVINALNKFEDVYSKYDENLMKTLFIITKNFVTENRDKYHVLTMLDFLDDKHYKELVEIIIPMYEESTGKKIESRDKVELL